METIRPLKHYKAPGYMERPDKRDAFLAHLPVNIRLVMDESLNYCRMPSLRKKIQ